MGEEQGLTNRVAERALLGVLLSNSQYFDRLLISFGDQARFLFAEPEHQVVFEAALKVLKEEQEPNIVSIGDKLDQLGVLDSIGGLQVLEELVQNASCEEKIEQLLSTLSDAMQRREIVAHLQQVISQAGAGGLDATALVNQTIDSLWSLNSLESANGPTIISPGEIWEARKEGIRELRKQKVFSSGYGLLDQKLHRLFFPGGITILCGRPGVGKSAFKGQLLENLCSSGAGVVSFCLEQDFQAEMDRNEARLSNIPLSNIPQIWMNGQTDPRFQRLKEVAKSLDAKWNIHYVDSRAVKVADVKRLVSLVQKKSQVDVVALDLFDRLQDVREGRNLAERITQKLHEIARIAQELKVHMLLVVQVNREAAKRKEHRPTIDTLKSSGGYEEAADLILALYRPSFDDPHLVEDITEVLCLKQRHGPDHWKVKFEMDDQTLRFVELDQKDEEDEDGDD